MVEDIVEINLGDGFGEVAVSANGARIVIHADGSVEPMRVANPQVGDKMPDGTIYAGVSPDTGKPMYAAPKAAPQLMRWRSAVTYATTLDANGHTDWRLPTRAELMVLYESRRRGALKGTFNESGSGFPGCYWSSSRPPDPTAAWSQQFRDGTQDCNWDGSPLSVRLVRG